MSEQMERIGRSMSDRYKRFHMYPIGTFIRDRKPLEFVSPTVQTEEFPDGVKLELERIYHRKELAAANERAWYWKTICIITWAVVIAVIALSESGGSLPK